MATVYMRLRAFGAKRTEGERAGKRKTDRQTERERERDRERERTADVLRYGNFEGAVNKARYRASFLAG